MKTAHRNAQEGTFHHAAANNCVITSLENAAAPLQQILPKTAACAVQGGLVLIVLWHSEEMAAT